MVEYSEYAPAPAPISSNAPRVYNILLLGPTQSGKSSFLESVKKYADPTYQVDDSLIGHGVSSCTQDVREDVVTTTLPDCKLYNKDNNVEFDLSRFLREKNMREFKRLLVDDDDLELRSEHVPGSDTVRFRFFDTPGLDDTNGDDIQNIGKTFSALIKTKEFHMILILGSCTVPLLPSQKGVYRAYFRLLEELRGIITVVHTRVPSIERHPGNTEFEPGLSERSRFFDEVMGREVPAKRIDCNFSETGPVHNYLVRRTIREVLVSARETTSVFIDRTYVHKALTMIPVDKIVHRRCKDKLDEISSRFELEISRIEKEIEETRAEIKYNEELLHQHDTDDPEEIYKNDFNEEWSLFRWPKEIVFQYPEQELTIDNIDLEEQSTYLLDQSGGKGHKKWEVRFKRRFFQDGYFHVVLSVARRKKYCKEIEGWAGKLETLKKLRETQTNVLDGKIKELRMMRVAYSRLVEQTSRETLPLQKFIELANAGIYQGSDIEKSAEKLEAFLKEEAELSKAE
ncbi:hypothetical protein B0O80DRAFT_141169 [Mortierella sp. GBAus27b]|nr:hypothetical protein BGX31_008677 [Mortierella sp. GBA43]KAI8349815.1 hypothetical protein B0O80DRAFT_141169 [Mortierella sp. GBAus27b]